MNDNGETEVSQSPWFIPPETRVPASHMAKIVNINSRREKVSRRSPLAQSLFLRVVEDLEATAIKADLSNDEEFHTLLWLAMKLTPLTTMELVTDLREWLEQQGDDKNKSVPNDSSLETKINRWINYRSSPKSLRVRQKIIACAIHSLREAVDANLCLPQRIDPDGKCSANDHSVGEIGLGPFCRSLHFQS